MADLFSEFLETPTGASFTALRTWLLQQPEYDFASLDLQEIALLAEEEEYAALLDRAEDAMPNWLLSPGMHQFIAEAARSEGDEERAVAEEYLVKACLAGLVQSGDGSAIQPYLITHPADEYDLLEALGQEAAKQESLTGMMPPVDRIQCEDGTELHFDLTPAFFQAEPTNS